MNRFQLIPPFTILLILSNPVSSNENKFWYSKQQQLQGEVLFKQNCAVCHGQNAEATANWKETDANGNYPPPPLNGTAHAWHHSLDLLRKTVREGGQKMGGLMPPFADRLTDEQIDSVIAYFQSKWSDELYEKWAGRFLTDKTIPPISSNNTSSNSNNVTRLLKQRLGNVELPEPNKTAVEGVWQVKYNNRYIYVIDNGNYAIIGDFIDLKNGNNLTQRDRSRSE